MAERSFPFDGGAGAAITEAEWSMLAQIWQDSGVAADGPSDPSLKVFSLGEPGVIYVSPGQAQLRGFHYINTDDLSLTVPANTHPSYSRIDIVVLQLDRNTNAVRAVYKAGTPAATPVAPPVDRTFESYEVLLARVVMGANMTVPPDSSPGLTDAREFIGKRIRHVWSGADTGAPDGSIVYRQADGAFLARTQGQDLPIAVGEIAPPGATLCTSSTRPSNPTPGLIIFETDTLRTYVWYGGSWQTVGQPTNPVMLTTVKSSTLRINPSELVGDGTFTITLPTPYQYILDLEVFYSAEGNGASIAITPHTSGNWSACTLTCTYQDVNDNPVRVIRSGLNIPIPIFASTFGQIYSFRITGLIRPSGGNLVLRMDYANATHAFDIRANSYMRAYRAS